jgi:hypothetical protein
LQRSYTRDRLIADQRFAGSGVGVATPASTRVEEQQSAAGKHQCPGTTIGERTSEEMNCIFFIEMSPLALDWGMQTSSRRMIASFYFFEN